MPSVRPRRKIPTIAARRQRVWRCVPVQFVATVLESGPSFTKDRRYSVQGEFGAIYLSASEELALLEWRQRAGEDAEPAACIEFELTLDHLVDLTSKAVQKRLGVQTVDLVRPRIAAEAYAATQAVARQVYAQKHHGLIVPSIHDSAGEEPGWFNIVLYPANLVHRCLRQITR